MIFMNFQMILCQTSLFSKLRRAELAITLVVRECALCPQVYYVQKLRAISDVPLVILLARVQI